VSASEAEVERYGELARTLTARSGITDAWIDGKRRFSDVPVVLSAADHAALARAAEDVAEACDELCRIVAGEPSLLDDFFRLTPVQKLLFEASFPRWHGHARADVFLRHGAPPVVCELNGDTPSGQPEAIALGALAREQSHGELADPSASLPRALVALVRHELRQLSRPVGSDAPPTVGILYPTELPEDLPLVAEWRRLLEASGYRVLLGSPFNLHATNGDAVGLFGERVDVVIRHYKTDWWGEREPCWRDQAPFPDPVALSGPLRVLLAAELSGRCRVVNPFGAVLPQNKRSYAFFWEQLARFSERAQRTIRTHVPYTVRFETADRAALRAERAEWVLKSDYGCEGEEVCVGASMSDTEWQEALELAVPHRFVAQRRFDPMRDEHGRAANHGVFLVAGRAAGLYTRLSVGPTDVTALSVPALVRP
jgi:glutathionylspermidine synthase